MDKITSQLADFFSRYSRWVVLTGAGMSADSGIPTYRDDNGTWLRNRPIQHQEFIQHAEARQRYWGRSMIGWPYVRDARPNSNHMALTKFERSGRPSLIITQNVDRLHQTAGSQHVIDLHGRLDRVVCLDCGAGYERDRVQQELTKLNPQHRGFAGAARKTTMVMQICLRNRLVLSPSGTAKFVAACLNLMLCFSVAQFPENGSAAVRRP